jgi:uncharacterized protein YlaI
MDGKLRNLVILEKLVYGLLLTGLIAVVSACSPAATDGEQPIVIEPANAEAGVIQLNNIGSTIILDASESTGTGLTFHWTFRSIPAGSTVKLSDFEAANPSFIVDQPGTYVAQLVVMDSAEGTSKDFTVVNILPTSIDALTDTLLDHAALDASCHECHDGVSATGKPVNHIESTSQCVVCHSVAAWSPNIAIDHNEILGTCSTCHNGIRAPGKPLTHIETTAECNQCHNAGTTFTIAIMPGEVLTALDDDDEEEEQNDHPPIGDLMCVDCHNNVVEEGKPDDHIPASDNCAACHTTSDWDIAGSSGGDVVRDEDDDDDEEEDDEKENDHPPIGNLMCIDCHNNVAEEGKEDDHILATDACEACHNTNDWEPVVTVDHTQVIGECSSCHNNDIAQGKPNGHVDTTSECNICHSTAGWTPTTSGGAVNTVDHSVFTTATVCMDCHNGSVATGKPSGHVDTSSDCDVCHTTTAW